MIMDIKLPAHLTDRELRAEIKRFRRPDNSFGIYSFIEIYDDLFSYFDIEKHFIFAKKHRIRCLIPCLSESIAISGELFGILRRLYSYLIPLSRKYGIKIGVHMQSIIEKSYFSDTNPHNDSIRARMLTRMDHFFDRDEHVSISLEYENVLAVTAYDEEYSESYDLTDMISEGKLSYDSGDRHLMLHVYVCDSYDRDLSVRADTVNKLSHSSYATYINEIFDLLGDEVKCALGHEITFFYASELCFDTPNRRDWDEEINTEFFKKYGVSACAYYDALYDNIGPETQNIKNCFFRVRAEMFKAGVIAAIRDFSLSHGLEYTYSLCESKIPACSWLFGDGMNNFEHSACATLDKAYLYGLNSLRLASSAATQHGYDKIYCDIYKGYPKISKATFYDDALNAFSEGVTQLMAHMPRLKPSVRRRKPRKSSDMLEYSRFAMRCQQLLSGGHRICDIAVLYPIDSIHSEVNLYQKREDKFEYPPTQIQNDYMTLLNILNVNCAQNAVLIHPDELLECSVRNKRLALDEREIEFKMLFIPGSTVMSLEVAKKIKDFYDAGGKVAATVTLPKFASEFIFDEKQQSELSFMQEYGNKNDTELRDILRHIFGDDALDPSLIRAYFKNTNKNGGISYCLFPTKTAADGSLYVSPGIIRGLIYNSGTPLDVYMSNMPAVMNTNGFSTSYPEFKGLGMAEFIPYGGIINHLHKARGNIDIYFFSNTTHERYTGTAFLRGKMKPAFYSPKGIKKRLPYRYVNHKGYVYTAIKLGLDHGDAVFIITRTYYEIASADNGYRFVSDIEEGS